MPSQVIASGKVLEFQFSKSGRVVLYSRWQPTSVEEAAKVDVAHVGKWFAYDRVTKVTKEISVPGTIQNAYVMGDDQTVYFSAKDREFYTGFYSLVSGKVTPVSFDGFHIQYSGQFAFAPFLVGNDDQNQFAIFLRDGSKRVFKTNPDFNINFLRSDDKSLYFSVRPKKRSTTPSKLPSLGTLEVATGVFSIREFSSLSEWDQMLDWLKVDSKFHYDSDLGWGYIELESDANPADGNRPDRRNVLISQRGKVGPSDGYIEFSYDDSAILYLDAGSLLMREILPVKPEVASKLASDEAKAKLIKRAKIIGTAMMIYAADNDDELPGQDGWENKLSIYLKDKTEMRDFTYSYKGGSTDKIENLSTTELGFILGPGGRAVVYLDGSAKWIPNP